MDLILWRHADAEPHAAGGDLARALTAKGEKQAMQMAAWLNARLGADARVLSSPAVRCQQTARALGRSIRTLDSIAPEVPGQNVLDAAGWPDGDGTVVVVGHQPTLGLAAALALTGRAEAWPVKKAAAWWIGGGRGADGAELVAVQVPALL
jgi:phosphohistidine phosphatase